ncbi:MAG: hypothetical protein NC203_03530 [Firmicutes bacterium]|nr:hypothetical protein [Bacillota bacterium]
MKHHRVIEGFCILSLAAVSVIFVYLSGSFFKDIAAGTVTETTDLYEVSSYPKNAVDTIYELQFVSSGGEYVYIALPKAAAEELGENPVTGESEKFSQILTLPYHRKKITVEYYPNSKTLVGAEISE